MSCHVSVTGIKLKASYCIPSMMAYLNALPSHKDAVADGDDDRAENSVPGLLLMEGDCIQGVHYTLCTWKDKPSMIRHLRLKEYARVLAMAKEFGSLAKVLTYRCETNTARPSLDAMVCRQWEELGTPLFDQRPPQQPKVDADKRQAKLACSSQLTHITKRLIGERRRVMSRELIQENNRRQQEEGRKQQTHQQQQQQEQKQLQQKDEVREEQKQQPNAVDELEPQEPPGQQAGGNKRQSRSGSILKNLLANIRSVTS